jgi:hypothetical protein
VNVAVNACQHLATLLEPHMHWTSEPRELLLCIALCRIGRRKACRLWSCDHVTYILYVDIFLKAFFVNILSIIKNDGNQVQMFKNLRRSPLRVSPNQGPYHQIRARLASQWEAGLKNISIIWISGGRRGGVFWVNPSSKCAPCHSNETDQRNIHTHVNVSLKAYVYDETIYNSCARARFPGCTYLRHIILALNTVHSPFFLIHVLQ